MHSAAVSTLSAGSAFACLHKTFANSMSMCSITQSWQSSLAQAERLDPDQAYASQNVFTSYNMHKCRTTSIECGRQWHRFDAVAVVWITNLICIYILYLYIFVVGSYEMQSFYICDGRWSTGNARKWANEWAGGSCGGNCCNTISKRMYTHSPCTNSCYGKCNPITIFN